MEVIKMQQLPTMTNKRGITAREVLKRDKVQINQLMLNPGDEIPPHAVPVHVFFYVLKGSGTLKIGDDEAVVCENDIIPCPEETEMSLKADQGEEFVVLNVKTPALN